MTPERLTDLRGALLALHKTLVDLERTEYEQVHGPVSAGEMLQLLINSDRFSWLHPISELIVKIDELIGNANERRRPTPARPAITREQAVGDAAALLAETRRLLASDDAPTAFREHYFDLAERHPVLGVMHQAVMRAFPPDPS
jgi:hypothetical protein